MKTSTKIIVIAGVLGSPIWILPNAKAVLGPSLSYALAACAFAIFGAGLWRWYCDGE